ncbi:MAG TPA: VOC family protein [Candidatus Paceibacterota bacterium]
MIEHVSVPVKSAAKAKKLYERALKPLGYQLTQDYDDAAGFKEGGHTSFWIVKHAKVAPMHVALRAKSRKAVDDFYRIAREHGAKDNGKPGYRDYSPGYYAAFILDADGNNIEAVWFDPKKEKRVRKRRA